MITEGEIKVIQKYWDDWRWDILNNQFHSERNRQFASGNYRGDNTFYSKWWDKTLSKIKRELGETGSDFVKDLVSKWRTEEYLTGEEILERLFLLIGGDPKGMKEEFFPTPLSE